ncbi:hypothetical protein NPIL_132531 [Nephila pilipes]|uniref:Uncharacterized protein n=1 Tax=Nephila pilipes TaxID=299642 RepID=A0A8X6Q3B1_NEPPI|nr:hypothetical protein NPIL_132531 [Nephila pilipes]
MITESKSRRKNTFHTSYATINFNRVPNCKTSPNNMKNITSTFRLASADSSEANAENEVKVQPIVIISPSAMSECEILEKGKTADVKEIECFFFNLANAIHLNDVDKVKLATME